ncbi:hypothetical protein [Catelliglobosispora koreensis]|uniref:hypothetical protein n=1 Tax=Catelliglobosispora koreensis TaxID=129052 RepID=UPI000365097A|nr:hypothetical protein [Catelliglobosispora koreensis]
MSQETSQPLLVDSNPEGALEHDLSAFIEQAELTGVRLTSVFGAVKSEDPVTAVGMTQKIRPQIRYRIDGFDCKFDVDSRILDGDGEERARIAVHIVASFDVPGDLRDIDGGPPQELLTLFVQQVAYFVVFPYLRATIQDMSMKLGLGAITLGLLRADGNPTNFTFAPLATASAAPTSEA